jgi:hypothetical protein
MGTRPSRVEQAIELMIEEIMERMETRARPEPATLKAADADRAAAMDAGPGTEPPPAQLQDRIDKEAAAPEGEQPSGEPEADHVEGTGPSHATKLMQRMVLWLVLAVVLINVPFNRHGVTLATAMPDTASLIVRDGLVVKEEDDPEIYVYRDGRFRWISSLDAFEHYGFTWKDVHIVPDGYLDRYEIGSPIHVLLKCTESPHIYRLEDGKKRWIRDIDTFVAEGHVWEDVRFVSCSYLAGLPDGETIPPGAGPPPQP